MEFRVDQKKIGWGLTILGSCSLVGMGYVFWTNTTNETLASLEQIRPSYIFTVTGLVLLDLWLGGIRNHIFIRKMKPGIRSQVSFRANLANIFLGAVTPAQTGGGAAQLYIFHRAQVPLSGAIATSVFNMLSTMIFFIVSVAAILYFGLGDGQFATGIWLFIMYSFAAFSVLLVLFLLSLMKPQWLEKLITILQVKTKGAQSRFSNFIFKAIEHALVGLKGYRQHAAYFLGKARKTLWLSATITLLLYWNKYNIAYTIISGLNQECSYWDVIFLQNIQFFILYFSPTPGASGIAELSAASIMKSQIMPALMPIFAVLWRTFTVYISVLLGGIILWLEIKKAASKN